MNELGMSRIIAVEQEMKFVSAKQILEENFTGMNFLPEAVVVDCAADQIQKYERKPTGFPKKRCLTSADIQILDILLFDKTGSIMCTLQNEAVEAIMEIVAMAPSARIQIRIEYFNVAEPASPKWKSSSQSTSYSKCSQCFQSTRYHCDFDP